MQIDNSGSISNQVRNTQDSQRTQQQDSQRSPSTQATGLKDTVTITNAATQLSQIEQQIKNVPDTDIQHIAELQSALKTGDYSPDPGKVAGKLLNFEAALNNVRH